jgi:hypothetical protein
LIDWLKAIHKTSRGEPTMTWGHRVPFKIRLWRISRFAANTMSGHER